MHPRPLLHPTISTRVPCVNQTALLSLVGPQERVALPVAFFHEQNTHSFLHREHSEHNKEDTHWQVPSVILIIMYGVVYRLFVGWLDRPWLRMHPLSSYVTTRAACS